MSLDFNFATRSASKTSATATRTATTKTATTKTATPKTATNETSTAATASRSGRTEVTELLLLWNAEDPEALNRLMANVFADLRRVARNCMRQERCDHTLQPTALVHELYLRLAGQRQVAWESRYQFFAFAADLMRRVLVDHARRHRAEKRGQGARPVPLDEVAVSTLADTDELLQIDEALHDLARLDARQAKVVELRFFCGLRVSEIAEVLDISRATVLRDWRTAKIWLSSYLQLSCLEAGEEES